MDRVNFLMIATTQFEPFMWIREDPKDDDTDAEWAKRIDAESEIRVDNPLLYLYIVHSTWDSMYHQDYSKGILEQAMKLAVTVFSVEVILMLAEAVGLEDLLRPKLPIADFIDVVLNEDGEFIVERADELDRKLDSIWFYKLLRELSFFTNEVDNIARVMIRQFDQVVSDQKEYDAAHPDLPPESSELDKSAHVDALRLLLRNVYAVFIIDKRFELFEFLQFIAITQSTLGSGRVHPLAAGRSDFTLYVRGDDDSDVTREVLEYYGDKSVEMAKRLQVVAQAEPVIGDVESRLLLETLVLMPMDQIEPGVWRFDPGVPQTSIWDAIHILGGPAPPKLTWIQFPSRTLVGMPVFGAGEPFVDDVFDPSTFDPAISDGPIAVDLGMHQIEQFLLDPREWLTAMSSRPEQLRIAAALFRYAGFSRSTLPDISVLDTLDKWKICVSNPTGGPTDMTAERVDTGDVIAQGTTGTIGTRPNPGSFRLVRLSPVEPVTLI